MPVAKDTALFKGGNLGMLEADFGCDPGKMRLNFLNFVYCNTSLGSAVGSASVS